MHESMNASVAKVVEHKNILTFRDMLNEVQYVDRKLAEDMASGFRLVGDFGPTGAFPPCPDPCPLAILFLLFTEPFAGFNECNFMPFIFYLH